MTITHAEHAATIRRGFALMVKTSGRTGQKTYYLSAPRPRSDADSDFILAHARSMLRDVGAPVGSAVFIDWPNWRGQPRRKEFTWE